MSIALLLMAGHLWRLAVSRWYWLCITNCTLFSTRKNFKYMCHLSVEKWKPIFTFREMTSAWQGFASCGPIIWLCWCKCITVKHTVKTQYNTAANCKHVFLSENSAILTIGITDFTHWERLGRISVPITDRYYCDVIIGAMVSQITGLTIAYSTVYSGAD